MTFEEAFQADLGTHVRVSNGLPPPSQNREGAPYQGWLSSNFPGTIVEQYTRNGWRYIRVKMDDDLTTPEVEDMSFEIAEGLGHFFLPDID